MKSIWVVAIFGVPGLQHRGLVSDTRHPPPDRHGWRRPGGGRRRPGLGREPAALGALGLQCKEGEAWAYDGLFGWGHSKTWDGWDATVSAWNPARSLATAAASAT